MPSYVNYSWVKIWAVQTPFDNPVQAGEIIVVNDRKGGSAQEVLSVTAMFNQQGGQYKTLLLRALTQEEVFAEAARREKATQAITVS